MLLGEDVERLCDEHLGDWAERWIERSDEILTRFRLEYLWQCEQLVGHITADLSSITPPSIDVEPADRRPYRDSSLQIVRDSYMTYSAIDGMAGKVTKSLGFGAGVLTAIGVFSNPIGLALGAAAGIGYVATRIWAGVRGYEMARERQRDAAIQALEQCLRSTGAEAQKSANRAFEQLSAALDSESKAHIDGFRLSMKNEFTARKQEIVRGKARTVAENREAEEILNKTIGRYQELMTQYQVIRQAFEVGGTS